MPASKHTPEPWWMALDDKDSLITFAIGSGDTVLARHIRERGDAALLVKAPAMYSILDKLREWAEVGGTVSMYASFDDEGQETVGEAILRVLREVE